MDTSYGRTATTQRRTVLGWLLVCEALDSAPDSLSWRERCALVVLAGAADDDTRDCPPGIEDQADIIRRLRLGRTERYSVLASLVSKGVLMRMERGRNGVRALFSIAFLGAGSAPKGPGNPDPSRGRAPVDPVGNPVDPGMKGPGNPDPSGAVKGPENPDASDLKGPENPDPSRGDTVLSRSFKDQDDLISRAHARTREAIRASVPGIADDEIDETIRIIRHRYSVRNIEVYIRRMIKTSTLEEHIPCGLGDRRHSNGCRSRDCSKCTASWCEGRCHGSSGSSSQPGRVRSA